MKTLRVISQQFHAAPIGLPNYDPGDVQAEADKAALDLRWHIRVARHERHTQSGCFTDELAVKARFRQMSANHSRPGHAKQGPGFTRNSAA
jgi:hypothetical protein